MLGRSSSNQGGPAAAWFIGGVSAAGLLAAYGSARAAPRRALALTVAGTILTALGLVGIASVGLPILLAGVLALIAAVRTPGKVPTPRSPG